jgi:hypothetical protein
VRAGGLDDAAGAIHRLAEPQDAPRTSNTKGRSQSLKRRAANLSVGTRRPLAKGIMTTADLRHSTTPVSGTPLPRCSNRPRRAPVIAAGEGFDRQRRPAYLDGVSSLWCNVHGHRVQKLTGHLRPARALAHDAPGTVQTCRRSLAAELVRRAPRDSTASSADNGSTAVEALDATSTTGSQACGA